MVGSKKLYPIVFGLLTAVTVVVILRSGMPQRVLPMALSFAVIYGILSYLLGYKASQK